MTNLVKRVKEKKKICTLWTSALEGREEDRKALKLLVKSKKYGQVGCLVYRSRRN